MTDPIEHNPLANPGWKPRVARPRDNVTQWEAPDMSDYIQIDPELQGRDPHYSGEHRDPDRAGPNLAAGLILAVIVLIVAAAAAATIAIWMLR